MTTTFIGAHPNNYFSGRQGSPITAIVCHWIVGHLNAADATFQDGARVASAHYGVEDGTIHQFVKEEDTAYHAGSWPWNLRSIGIEHAGGPDIPITDATYETSAQLVADIAARYGIPLDRDHVKRHGKVTDTATQCPGALDVDRIVRRAKELHAPGGVPYDMNPLRIAKDLYAVLDASYSPPDTVIQDKADAIASTDSLIPVLHDLLGAKPWRSPEDYNFAALEAYATAKGFPDPKQYAFDRVSGGDTFDQVIAGDLSADKAHADQLTQLNEAATAQLNSFSQAIHDLQSQVATLNNENQSLHIALEKTEQTTQPNDQTPDSQPLDTPEPATEPAPAPELQPDQTPTNDPVAEPEPQRMSYLAGLYYLLSKLFLGR